MAKLPNFHLVILNPMITNPPPNQSDRIPEVGGGCCRSLCRLAPAAVPPAKWIDIHRGLFLYFELIKKIDFWISAELLLTRCVF